MLPKNYDGKCPTLRRFVEINDAGSYFNELKIREPMDLTKTSPDLCWTHFDLRYVCKYLLTLKGSSKSNSISRYVLTFTDRRIILLIEPKNFICFSLSSSANSQHFFL